MTQDVHIIYIQADSTRYKYKNTSSNIYYSVKKEKEVNNISITFKP